MSDAKELLHSNLHEVSSERDPDRRIDDNTSWHDECYAKTEMLIKSILIEGEASRPPLRSQSRLYWTSQTTFGRGPCTCS
jgi:hypothetical protein